MSDEWDKYIVKDAPETDEWEQYAVQESSNEKNNFPVSDNPIIRNVVDPFFMAGTEMARGYNRGGAAVMTPLAMLLKAGRVPDQYNFAENTRNYLDAQADSLPKTSLDPISKFVFEQGAALPGNEAAFMQVATPIMKAGGAAIQSIKGTKLFQDVTKKVNFLDDVRSSFYEAKAGASEKYGAGIEKLAQDNPDKLVNMKPVVDQIKQAIADEPKLRNAVRRVPALDAMLDDAWKSTDIKIGEAQKLVNDLQSKITSGKLRGLGVRPDDIPLLDAIHDIKYQMVEAFPEVRDLRSAYGETINKFNLVRNKIKPGSLMKNIESGFGDPEVKNAADTLLQEFPQIKARIRNYNILRKMGQLTALGAGGLGIKKGLDWVTN